jgi:hypothetical protein
MSDIMIPGEFEILEPENQVILEDRVELEENMGFEQFPRLMQTLQHIRFEMRRFGQERAYDIMQSIYKKWLHVIIRLLSVYQARTTKF